VNGEYTSQLLRGQGTITTPMRSPVIAIFVTLSAAATLAGGACSKDSQSPPGEDSQRSQVEAMYNAKCARCHGADGAGNGPSADSLHPRPHNYTDPAWQAGITDAQIKEIIVRGGINLGKSPAMPGNPTLKNHPEVLDGLVRLIRSFGKHP